METSVIFFKVREFLSKIQSDQVAEDLITIYKLVYKYKNAQRKQKVYQTIEGISRCRVGEYKSYLEKEVERFELVVLKLGGEIDEVKEILGGLVTEFGRRLRRAVKLCREVYRLCLTNSFRKKITLNY